MPYTTAPEGWWREFISATPARTAKLAVVRADGSPHVAPVWVDLDGDDIVFQTGANTVKGKAILRDPEARGARKIDQEYGRMREPVLFWTAMIRALDIATDRLSARFVPTAGDGFTDAFTVTRGT